MDTKKRLDSEDAIEERERIDERRERYIYIYIYTHETFRRMEYEARNKPGWRPPLNVTQAAVHKERWREQITQKKCFDYYIILFFLLSESYGHMIGYDRSSLVPII